MYADKRIVLPRDKVLQMDLTGFTVCIDLKLFVCTDASLHLHAFRQFLPLIAFPFRVRFFWLLLAFASQLQLAVASQLQLAVASDTPGAQSPVYSHTYPLKAQSSKMQLKSVLGFRFWV